MSFRWYVAGICCVLVAFEGKCHHFLITDLFLSLIEDKEYTLGTAQ